MAQDNQEQSGVMMLLRLVWFGCRTVRCVLAVSGHNRGDMQMQKWSEYWYTVQRTDGRSSKSTDRPVH